MLPELADLFPKVNDLFLALSGIHPKQAVKATERFEIGLVKGSAPVGELFAAAEELATFLPFVVQKVVIKVSSSKAVGDG